MNHPLNISKFKSDVKPEISVLLPVYNGGEYLKLSLLSVLQQNFKNFELLIIDDCSTDRSFDYLQSVKDDRINLFRNQHNQGLFYNINFLISKSNSPLIKLWAQDDIMNSQCLQAFVNFHKKYPDIGFSYSGRDMIDESGQIRPIDGVDNTPAIISTALHAKIAYYTGSIAGNIANVCIKKDALDKVGSFNENMKISADFDMWVRLAKDHETGFINEKLIRLRDHSGQLSRNEKYYINHVKEDLEVYRYLDSYVTPEQKKTGHQLMQNSKLLFYYTLMLKSFLKADFKTTGRYFKLISAYTNIWQLTINFFKRIINKKKSNFKIA